MATCKACGQEFAENQLLNDGDGLICVNCESDRESDEAFRKDVWRAIAGPPASVGVTALLLFLSCFPVVGMFTTPLAVFAGFSSIWQCYRGIRFWMTLRDEEVIEEVQKVGLLVTSIVSIPPALALTGWSILQTVALVMMVAGYRPGY